MYDKTLVFLIAGVIWFQTEMACLATTGNQHLTITQ